MKRYPVKNDQVCFDMIGVDYLNALIIAKEHLIFLQGYKTGNPRIRTFSSWEDINYKHYIELKQARHLLKGKYFCKGILTSANKIVSEVWQRE